MKTSIGTALLLGAVVLAGALPGIAQGCLGHAGGAGSCCASGSKRDLAAANHEGHTAPVAAPATTALSKLDATDRLIFEHYFAVQTALASDSAERVPASASLLAKALRADGVKSFPTAIVAQVDALAQARDLVAARKAFRPLSESLIKYVKSGKVTAGTFYEVYCPMAKASWLQADKVVRNPYFGRSMLDCGVAKPV